MQKSFENVLQYRFGTKNKLLRRVKSRRWSKLLWLKVMFILDVWLVSVPMSASWAKISDTIYAGFLLGIAKKCHFSREI